MAALKFLFLKSLNSSSWDCSRCKFPAKICKYQCPLSGRSFPTGGKVRCKISGGTVHRAGLGKQRLSTLGPGGLTHLLQEDLSGSEHVRASEEDED